MPPPSLFILPRFRRVSRSTMPDNEELIRDCRRAGAEAFPGVRRALGGREWSRIEDRVICFRCGDRWGEIRKAR